MCVYTAFCIDENSEVQKGCDVPTVMQKVDGRAKEKTQVSNLWCSSGAFLPFGPHVFISKVIKLLSLPCVIIGNVYGMFSYVRHCFSCPTGVNDFNPYNYLMR